MAAPDALITHSNKRLSIEDSAHWTKKRSKPFPRSCHMKGAPYQRKIRGFILMKLDLRDFALAIDIAITSPFARNLNIEAETVLLYIRQSHLTTINALLKRCP